VDDFEVIDPHRAMFLRQLTALAAQRRAIESDTNLTDSDKIARIQGLTLSDSQARVEDLG
jgi:lipase chaperone LimK